MRRTKIGEALFPKARASTYFNRSPQGDSRNWVSLKQNYKDIKIELTRISNVTLTLGAPKQTENDTLSIFNNGPHAYIGLFLFRKNQLWLADGANDIFEDNVLLQQIRDNSQINSTFAIHYEHAGQIDFSASAAVCIALELARLSKTGSALTQIVPWVLHAASTAA